MILMNRFHRSNGPNRSNLTHWRTLLPILLLLLPLGCLLPHALHAEVEGKTMAPNFSPDDYLVKAVVGPCGEGTWVIPTTQLVTPAGKMVSFAGRPVSLALSPDGKTLAVKNLDSLVFFDVKQQAITQTLTYAPGRGATFCGVAWAPNGQTVWVTTTAGTLAGATRDSKGAFHWARDIPLTVRVDTKDFAPGGLAITPGGALAYVALSIHNVLAIVDLTAGKVAAQIPVGIAPYDVRLAGNKAYVTNWAGRRPRPGDLTGLTANSWAAITPAGIAASGTVSVIDLVAFKAVKEIEVELHPCGMALAPGGKRLYVANANSDSISVIDTASDAVTARWAAKPLKDLPLGSAPSALALSPDGARLYAALGGNNCIAVMETANGALAGLIPTGWYPGDLCLSRDGMLCVANTKGAGSRLRDIDPRTVTKYRGYASRHYLGSVNFVTVPDPAQLKAYTLQVGTNMRLPRMAGLLESSALRTPQPAILKRLVPVPTRPGEVSLFKHVIYIIKENRTYDQILGDLPQGNGDPSLVTFGRKVTPNHHALAEEFVLLDNFYCNGVLSADGHQWTDEGFVTDYLEKSFGGFTRSYPYEGNDVMAFASSGFIWDHVLRAGLSFRDYGEMVHATLTPAKPAWSQVYNDYKTGQRTVKIQAQSAVRGLQPYTCPTYIGFPMSVPDVYRAGEFLKELRQFEARGVLPNFIIMMLPGDHTSGTRPGMPSPRASMADNDLALGRIVEAVSKSRFWRETIIFVVEDDPQSGLDHVDGHRTVALCVSPYTRRGAVVSTHYNQTGMLRTIELILGVGPMTQLTMAANPMVECFTDKINPAPYQCKPNNIPLDEMNPPLTALRGQQLEDARQSIALPLDEVDKADEETFNRILWRAAKGANVPYPKLKTSQPSEPTEG